MATTFAQAEVALAEIATKIVENRNRLAQCKALAITAESALAGMPGLYTTVVQDINAAAAAAPADTELQSLKLRKDKLVTEFGALNSKATEMKNATAAIVF